MHDVPLAERPALMEPELVAKVAELADTILTTKASHAFAKAVGTFVQALATVPDYPAATFSDDAVSRLLSLSEQVIEQIEQRLNTEQDRAAVQQDIVGAVYEIRRVLENIDRWRRHYRGE
jgi:hypothetical protein